MAESAAKDDLDTLGGCDPTLSLPDELMEKIFLQIRGELWDGVLERVCRRWERIVQESPLVKRELFAGLIKPREFESGDVLMAVSHSTPHKRTHVEQMHSLHLSTRTRFRPEFPSRLFAFDFCALVDVTHSLHLHLNLNVGRSNGRYREADSNGNKYIRSSSNPSGGGRRTNL